MTKLTRLVVVVLVALVFAMPAIAHDTQNVAINGGASYTITREAVLALVYTGVPVPTQMRVRNEGEEWPEWESYDSTKQWCLSEKDGVKTVYVETRYWIGVGWHTLSGNSSITYDTMPPVITAALSVKANVNGWNNTDVAVTFQATDALSGVASITGDTTVTMERENQSVTGQAVDKAGNVATFDVTGISIDKTLPIVTGTRSPEANTNGWNNTDVAVTFQATDALSGVASLTGDTTVIMEGANQSVTGQAVDKAGNVATFVVSGISIDKTLPIITGMLSPAHNAHGWNNTDVSVTFQATDALSGVESVTGDTTVTTEGQNQSVTGQAVDKAGNAATFVVSGISIDKTAPIVTGTRSPEANANGWNNTDVAVTFQATDALSGIASLTRDTTVTMERENQSVTGQAVDKAGNIASLNIVVHLDKTPPNISAHANPGAHAMVWNNADVSVTFQATDGLSGVESVTGDTTITTEGQNQSVMGQAVDKAGNVASAALTNINIDKALPALTIQVSGTDGKPTGEPLDALAILGSFDGFKSDDPIFAAGTPFFDEDANIIANGLVTLAIQEIISSPEPGTPGVKMVGFTTCPYSSVSQQYYVLFPTAGLSDGVYELWFTTNTRQSVRARIALKKTPE